MAVQFPFDELLINTHRLFSSLSLCLTFQVLLEYNRFDSGQLTTKDNHHDTLNEMDEPVGGLRGPVRRHAIGQCSTG